MKFIDSATTVDFDKGNGSGYAAVKLRLFEEGNPSEGYLEITQDDDRVIIPTEELSEFLRRLGEWAAENG